MNCSCSIGVASRCAEFTLRRPYLRTCARGFPHPASNPPPACRYQVWPLGLPYFENRTPDSAELPDVGPLGPWSTIVKATLGATVGVDRVLSLMLMLLSPSDRPKTVAANPRVSCDQPGQVSPLRATTLGILALPSSPGQALIQAKAPCWGPRQVPLFTMQLSAG